METDRQLIESGIALAQGLLTAHNSLSHNALLRSQLEKTMHIRKLSLTTHTHMRERRPVNLVHFTPSQLKQTQEKMPEAI